MSVAEHARPGAQRGGSATATRMETGDHLSLVEFMRRYEAMPDVKRVELIEGVVYIPSPVSLMHARPQQAALRWADAYATTVTALEALGGVTVLLDSDNVVEPDVLIRHTVGGTSRPTEKGYLAGAPEFVMEISYSSVSRDLHEKLQVYRRAGVQEYAVWRVDDGEIDWWELVEGVYTPLPVDDAGLCSSRVFPGLTLNVPAMLADDTATVLGSLREGMKGARLTAG